MQELRRNNENLLTLVRAARNITSQPSIRAFTQQSLETLNLIIKSKVGGIACLASRNTPTLDNLALITAATGFFEGLAGTPVSTLVDEDLKQLMNSCWNDREHKFTRDLGALYFQAAQPSRNSACLMAIKTRQPLRKSEINLLRVFSENIQVGFINQILSAHINELAFRDSLLQLYNRNWLSERILDALAAPPAGLQLIMFEFDGYGDMTATFGEEHCEELLRQLSNNLSRFVDIWDAQLARTSIACFAALIDKREDINRVIQQQCEQQLHLENSVHQVALTASVLPIDSFRQRTPEQILYLAQALIEDARRNQHSWQTYSSDFGKSMQLHYQTLHELRPALQRGQIGIALQPKVRLDNGRPIGFEALATQRRQLCFHRAFYRSGGKVRTDT